MRMIEEKWMMDSVSLYLNPTSQHHGGRSLSTEKLKRVRPTKSWPAFYYYVKTIF